MSRNIIIATAIFIGLSLAAAVLLFVASTYNDAFGRAVMLQMGGALFGAGITVYLLRLLGVATSR